MRNGTVPCPGCPAAISNPNPLEVTLKDGQQKAILLHFDTMNNPSESKHGLDMQIWSYDDGKTWIEESVLDFGTTENTGALIGPSVGIQAADGTIYFSMVFGGSHWLYFSKDYGITYTTSKPVPNMGECSIAFLVDSNDGRIIMSCRTAQEQRAQLIWSKDGVPGPITYPGIIDPRCQGSIVNDGNGTLYLSNANSTSSRTHMTVRKSVDQGKTWDEGVLVYSGASAYSQLVSFPLEMKKLGLIFETTNSTIVFTSIDIK